MSSPARLVIDDQNPWPGLGAFDEASQHFFNGRKNETAELHRLVLNSSLTVLFGASGLGKTSLIQAGLFPSSRKNHFFPVYVRLDIRDKSKPLIEQVRCALEKQVEAQGIDAPPFETGISLWRYLHLSGLELWSLHNQLLTPLFVFDQFEEVFTIGAENAAAVKQLRIDLADLIENRVPETLANAIRDDEDVYADLDLDSQRYRVVLSFREDFLPFVENWKRDLPSILRNRLRLLPMSAEGAFEAVHQTAPHLVSEQLAQQIVRFVASGTGQHAAISNEATELPVEPALLSLVCHGLNEERKAQGKAVLDAELLAGCEQSIISDFYQNATKDLPRRVQNFIGEQLITEAGYRKPYAVDDARSKYGVTESQLRLLEDRRMVRIEPQRGTEQVELTHDLLTRVVREQRDRRRQRKRIFAYLGVPLLLAGLLFALAAWQVASRQRRYEQKARDAEARLTNLQMVQALQDQRAGELAAEKQADEATKDAAAAKLAEKEISVEFLASKAALKGTEGESALPLSMLLAAESMRRQPLIDNQALLSKGLSLLPKPLGSLPNSSKIATAMFSRDGLLVTSEPNVVRVMDPVSRQLIRQFPVPGTAGAIAVSSDGELLAIAYDEQKNGIIRVYRLHTGELEGERKTVPAIQQMYVGSNGILTAFDGTIVYHWKDWAGQPVPLPEVQAVLEDGGAVAVSSNPALLALFDRNLSTISIPDLSNGRKNWWTVDQGSVVDIVFDPSTSDHLASFDYSGTIRLWSASSKQVYQTYQAGPLTGIEFSANGYFLAANGVDGTVKVWDLRDGRLVGCVFPKLTATTVAVDGTRGIIALVENGVSELWQMDEMPVANTAPLQRVLGIAADLHLAAGPCEDVASLCVVRFENGKTGSLVRKFKEPASPAGRLSFSRDGRFLSGGVRRRSHEETTAVWDITAGSNLGLPDENLEFLGFTPESDQLIVRTAAKDQLGQVKLWQLHGGGFGSKVPPPLMGNPAALAFSADGRWIGVATLVPGTSADASEMDAEDQDYRVSVWRWPAGTRPEKTFNAGPRVTMISFDADHRLVITASGEPFVRIWDLNTGKESGRVSLYRPGLPLEMAFAAGDTRVVAIDQYSVRNSPWRPQDLMKETCQRIGRSLSRQEWNKNLPGEKGEYFPTCEAYPPPHWQTF